MEVDDLARPAGTTDRCSWCGDASPRARRARSRVWVVCTACGARTHAYMAVSPALPRELLPDDGTLFVLHTGGEDNPAIDAAWDHWRRSPLVGPPARRAEPAPARKQRREKDEVDPLELLARLLVPSSYRVPVEGRSSRPGMTTSDVAAALGFMRSRLAKAVAIAVVTRADESYIARMTELARWAVRREVLMQRPLPLKLGRPADRWKLRLALFDAAHELVWPEKRTPYGELARRAKMRKRDYIVVHRCATHVLQEALANARGELRQRLYGR